MTPLFLVPLWATLTFGLVITEEKARLKPNKANIVLYRVNSEPFGFLPGANLTLDLKCNRQLGLSDKLNRSYGDDHRPTLFLFLCPRGMHDLDENQSLTHLCKHVEEEYNTEDPYKLSWYYTIQNEEFYQLVLKDIQKSHEEDICAVSAVFLNPGGRHLSSDQMLIPTCCIVIIVIWMLHSSLWLLNYIFYRRFSNRLQKLLTVIMMVKIINLCLGFIYWTQLDNNGRVNMRLHMPYMLCFTGFETLLLVLLMLAAEGWCIIWESPRLLKYYILLAGALFLMDVCFKYVHKYFQGFAIVFASMMIYIAFKCSTISISTIKKNITTSEQFIENHELTYKSEKTLKKRLNKKLRMFNFLQGLIIGLPCVYIVVQSVASFLLLYNDWVRLVLYEVLEFSAVVYCCVLFRLQDFEDYNNIVISTPFHEVTVVLTPNKHLVYISNQQEEAETSDDK